MPASVLDHLAEALLYLIDVHSVPLHVHSYFALLSFSFLRVDHDYHRCLFYRQEIQDRGRGSLGDMVGWRGAVARTGKADCDRLWLIAEAIIGELDPESDFARAWSVVV